MDLFYSLGSLDLAPRLPSIPSQVDDILDHEAQPRLHKASTKSMDGSLRSFLRSFQEKLPGMKSMKTRNRT